MQPTPEGSHWLERLLERFEAPLLHYAHRLLGNAELAREVVQDVFLRFVRERPGVMEDHTAEWLYTVCRNRAIDVRRKERRMTPMIDTMLEARPAPGESPADHVERRDDTHQAVRLLATLSDNQREVVRLKFQHGMSYQQISGITGLSVSNVGFLLHTAIKSIRERMTAEPGLAHDEGRRS